MLTHAEIASLRRKAAEAASRRTFKRPAVRLLHVGGPLDGWSEPVDEADLSAMFRGWCAVTPTGPVQAIYTIDAPSRRATFRDYVTGPTGQTTQHTPA